MIRESEVIMTNNDFLRRLRYALNLKDTVKPYNEYTGEGDGFGFKQANGDDMIKALRYAVTMYRRPEVWKEIIANAKKRDNSWKEPAKRYKEIYQKLLGN